MQVAKETPRKTGPLYLSTAQPTLRRPLTRKVGFYSTVIIPVFFYLICLAIIYLIIVIMAVGPIMYADILVFFHF